MLGEITDATVLSASEDNLNDVPITERPLNAYSRQIELKKGYIHSANVCHYFQKLKIKMTYKEMAIKLAKNIIKEYLCKKIFQRVYIEVISPKSFTKLLRCTEKLIDILTNVEFKYSTKKPYR